jgi:cytochrome c peroxidase
MCKQKGRSLLITLAAALPLSLMLSGNALAKRKPAELSPIEWLGKLVFFDTSLSTPGEEQGCVSCHDPKRGWTFPKSKVNEGPVGNPGAHPGRRGNIKPPTVAYTKFVVPFQLCSDAFGGNRGAPPGGRGCGGLFWDGRAEGWGALAADDPTVLGPTGDGAVSETVKAEDLPAAKRAEYKQYLGPLADQALNPAQKGIEQNAGEKKVCQMVKTAEYKDLYKQVFGERINCGDKPEDNPPYHRSFKLINLAVAAYEASTEVSPFNSPRDIALYKEFACLHAAGDATYAEYAEYYDALFCNSGKEGGVAWGEFPLKDLSSEVNWGHDIFYGVSSDLNARGIDGGCWRCHSDDPGADDGTEPKQTYMDQAYHNIGIPYNREIPDTAKGEVMGVRNHLTFRLDRPDRDVLPGFFRNPTLRELAQGEEEGFVKAFGHNGYFKSLEGIMHFYNTRDSRLADLNDPTSVLVPTMRCETLGLFDATEAEALANECWPAPEFPDGATTFGNVGRIGLTLDEEAAVVAYMRALTGITVPEKP